MRLERRLMVEARYHSVRFFHQHDHFHHSWPSARPPVRDKHEDRHKVSILLNDVIERQVEYFQGGDERRPCFRKM